MENLTPRQASFLRTLRFLPPAGAALPPFGRPQNTDVNDATSRFRRRPLSDTLFSKTKKTKQINAHMSPHRRTVVVSLLSPSATASRASREKLSALLGWTPVADVTTTSTRWDRVAMRCPHTGTFLQWLAPENNDRHKNKKNDTTTTTSPLGLLAVQEAASADEATETLQAVLAPRLSTTAVTLKRWMGRSPTIRDLLGRHELPLLQWRDRDHLCEGPDDDDEGATAPFAPGTLKEICLPTVDTAQYPDGQTLRQRLSSALPRPVTGLYRLPGGLLLRPLPTGTADRHVAPPSLIFHCDRDDEDGRTLDDDDTLERHRIGYNGSRQGQITLRTPVWHGLDVRLCPSTRLSSAFCEAQEALLAASLPGLQSAHVLDGADGRVDPKNLRMDCWVDFRESLKHDPVEFFRGSSRKGPKIAKVPDIPYE